MDAAGLTQKQLAGQRLMVGFDGTEFNRQLQFLIQTLCVGGLILFSRNITSPEQVKKLCRDAQDFARSCGHPPLLIAVDQEGGQVARLKAPFTEFPGNPKMRSDADAAHFARTTAEELKSVGINMNMAPVLDIAPEDIDSIMAGRSFGHDPAWVSLLGTSVIRHMQARGVMAVAKHFPGIGRTVLDSHVQMPTLDADLASLQQLELIPFRAAIEADVSGIMLSHIHYPALDPTWPASLSKFIAHDLLRHQMGFDGLVLTDDLDMGAIEKCLDIETAVHRALKADIDMMLICHWSEKTQVAFNRIRKYIEESPDRSAAGLKAARRILKAKAAFRLPW